MKLFGGLFPGDTPGGQGNNAFGPMEGQGLFSGGGAARPPQQPTWTLPGNSGSTLSRTFWDSDEGMRALYQNMSDFFSNGGQNWVLSNWFQNAFGAERNRYNQAAIDNKDLSWEGWLQQRAPQLMNDFAALPASLRGSQPGFTRRGRDLW